MGLPNPPSSAALLSFGLENFGSASWATNDARIVW